ncbi:Cox19p [Saccharomyces cerevisiae YJM1418]|nr:Cox19p [Saccharomyces cerevisiae YJM1418]CAD6640561.1 HLJ1_G0026780.mRNA.1.CDS.1 [Saccharomyces cerevisiae]
MSGNPGSSLSALRPTPPERGSFPLDHDGECTKYMQEYLKCMQLVQNENAMNCRLLAKDYLQCRMDHQLMDYDEWSHLGLPEDAPGNNGKTIKDATDNK